ncbi:hypothetical protein TNCT_101711 [Trichonephila clavata]|uniref:Uncharacterized protein n=1 Tax=Trichonephila clavata TaxID=2740835 RepID=A0A8X6HX72_TRICU|nr:hypothetical protein TNCT_101711 [Trichonephila clavata]
MCFPIAPSDGHIYDLLINKNCFLGCHPFCFLVNSLSFKRVSSLSVNSSVYLDYTEINGHEKNTRKKHDSCLYFGVSLDSENFWIIWKRDFPV